MKIIYWENLLSRCSQIPCFCVIYIWRFTTYVTFQVNKNINGSWISWKHGNIMDFVTNR